MIRDRGDGILHLDCDHHAHLLEIKVPGIGLSISVELNDSTANKSDEQAENRKHSGHLVLVMPIESDDDDDVRGRRGWATGQALPAPVFAQLSCQIHARAINIKC